MNRTQHVEHAILTLVLRHPDLQGYPVSIGTLTQILRERLAEQFPDLNQREIVDALERLSTHYLNITKHSSGRWRRYPDQVVGDLVFYRGDFRLARTPQTGPQVEKLAAELGLRERAMTSTISEEGRKQRFARWEEMGLDRVKADLVHNGGRNIGSGEVQDLAWGWVRMKEQEAALNTKITVAPVFGYIAEERLNALRALSSDKFDFSKLIRLCEEINIAYSQECFFATGILTRGLVDHVPPLFGRTNFDQVAANHGGQSVKNALRHLNETSKSVADALLHEQIGRRVSLPTAQRVDCRQQLDVLLDEIAKLPL